MGAMMELETSEDVPFLKQDRYSTDSSCSCRTKSSRHTFSNYITTTLAALLVLSNVAWLFVYTASSGDGCIRPKLIYCKLGKDRKLGNLLTVRVAPAVSAISYKRIKLWRSIEPDNVYTGEPRKELDEAWHKLLERKCYVVELLVALDDVLTWTSDGHKDIRPRACTTWGAIYIIQRWFRLLSRDGRVS